VNGQWLYKTRQIVTGRNKHPARWMLWRPNRRAQIPSALRSAKPIRWRYVQTRGYCPADNRCKIVLCYTSFDPRGRK
jgi:anti-sigma factor ChrR (cupin superfamily)